MTSSDDICAVVRQFLVSRVFNGKEPAELTEESPLLSSRLLDSITVLELVAELEKAFGIEFKAHELDANQMDSMRLIAKVVQGKLEGA